jgi:hypothetical protein
VALSSRSWWEIRAKNREFVLEGGDTIPHDVASVRFGPRGLPKRLRKERGAIPLKPVERTGRSGLDSYLLDALAS